MRSTEPPIPPVGARLADFVSEWERITEDQWVMNTVSQGFAIEFVYKPPLASGVRVTPVPKDLVRRLTLQDEVAALLEKGVVELIPKHSQGEGFYSTFFLVPKKPEGLRPILNLKPFNNFVVRKGFTLDSVRSVRST